MDKKRKFLSSTAELIFVHVARKGPQNSIQAPQNPRGKKKEHRGLLINHYTNCYTGMQSQYELNCK